MKESMSLEMCREMAEKLEEVRTSIDAIERNVRDVKQKQLNILADPFTDEGKKEDLAKLQSNIKLAATRVRRHLKDVDEKLKHAQASNSYTAAFRIQKSQYASLSKRFVDALSEYNQAEMDYRDRCKSRIQRKLDIAGMHVNEDQVDEMLKGDSAVFTQGIITDSQIAKQTLADIQARHADIVKLESDIAELHEMMSDMAMLIESQGDVVDRIDFAVGDAVVSIDQGTVDVKKAAKSKSSYRKKKFWLVVGLIIALAIIILIIILSIYTSRP